MRYNGKEIREEETRVDIIREANPLPLSLVKINGINYLSPDKDNVPDEWIERGKENPVIAKIGH